MRYFMISYYYKKSMYGGFGTYFYMGEKFPSISKISEELDISLGFLSVFEFDNIEDFQDAQS